MTDNTEDKDFKDVRNVERALVARLMDLSDDDLLAEFCEEGVDIDVEDANVSLLVQRSLGRARMDAARAQVSANKVKRRKQAATALPLAANDRYSTEGMTMAARNAKDPVNEDDMSVDEDLAELGAFDNEEPPA